MVGVEELGSEWGLLYLLVLCCIQLLCILVLKYKVGSD